MPSPPDPSKTYYIQNHFLGQYLMLTQSDLVAEGDKIADGHHQWRFVPVQGPATKPVGYYIQNVATNKFLTLKAYTKAASGLEEAGASYEPQALKIEPQAGTYWIIYIDGGITQNQRYYVNCYMNGFNFCNYNAYHNLDGCKEGERRQWAFIPVA